ncbi:hypothetical protein IWW36_001984 [Coemansia brasiliensis]|uniref:Nucleoside phosphorylase domain-containing protein n=1 Tax=Coemansia brasiliensis TaxID=2650707 RepID=A0A9W8IGR6_9FUNG|nr:hypothetical protein IWW36_001984 [Coemansia brasiliensis]
MPEEQMVTANRPISHEGRTYHMGTKRGELANRIITVGDHQRARHLSTFLDEIRFEHLSPRGFLTITGLYRSHSISIVAIGMGLSMMDFFVREARMVVDGPLSIIRFGSCGSICDDASIGDVIIAQEAFGITRNYEFFEESRGEPYKIWPMVKADPKLTGEMERRFIKELGSVVKGSVGNADSFYSSQGRKGDEFYDANDGLLESIREKYEGVVGLEMESHMLFHLAKWSTGRDNLRPPSIRAACVLMVYADRQGDRFIDPQTSKYLVEKSATVILDTLVSDLTT